MFMSIISKDNRIYGPELKDPIDCQNPKLGYIVDLFSAGKVLSILLEPHCTDINNKYNTIYSQRLSSNRENQVLFALLYLQKSMLEPNPEKRISVDDALDFLQRLSHKFPVSVE